MIANERQLKQLAQKEKAQPFGLKSVAKEFERFCGLHFPEKIEVMGIINANDDSFYALSRFNEANAVQKIEEMIEEGASIIDIGGVSSRPGSMGVSEEEELGRVKPIIDLLYHEKTYEKTRLESRQLFSKSHCLCT